MKTSYYYACLYLSTMISFYFSILVIVILYLFSAYKAFASEAYNYWIKFEIVARLFKIFSKVWLLVF